MKLKVNYCDFIYLEEESKNESSISSDESNSEKDHSSSQQSILSQPMINVNAESHEEIENEVNCLEK